MRSISRLCFAGLLAPATLSESGASRDAAIPVSGNEQIVVNLRVLGTAFDDGTYGSTTQRGSGDIGLRIEDQGHVYLVVGDFDGSGVAVPESLCMSATGAVPGPAIEAEKRKLTARAPHMWWADVRALPSPIGRVSFEITWEHLFSERLGEPVKIAGDTRRISMREGESQVLDYVDAGPSFDPDCYRNLTVEVRAKVAEDPALVDELLGYDLWFRHTDASGRLTERRFEAVGRQGEELNFQFVPLRFPAPEAVLDDGSILDSILEVGGMVQGRLRPDGSIDVRLSATRWVDAERAGTPRRGGIGDGGNKTFSVLPGETVAMKLPAPSGRNGIAWKSSGPPYGPEDSVYVDSAEFYAGHTDELILTITRAP